MKVFTTANTKFLFKNIGILIFYLLIWQFAYTIVQKDLYLPSPWQVLQRLAELVRELHFWQAVAFSMYRVGWGIALSVVAGVVLGVIAGWSNLCYNLLQPLVTAIKSTPVISFIIIALIWFSSFNAPVFICILMCFPIIWTNIVTGIRQVDQKLLEMAQVYRVKRPAVWHRIYLPSLLPYFTAAVVTSLGLGWKVSVAAEVLSHPQHAIGSQLNSSKVYMDAGGLFAWTLVVIFLSLLLEKILAHCLNKLNKRGSGYAKDQD
ncbi:MAG: ABC transporter permease [Clostridia bacterium]|nr:ABC transporter permease [Clostridia bacterium]